MTSKRNSYFTFRMFIVILILIGLIPMLPLIISGEWGWWQAWAYWAVNLLGFAISRYLVGRRNPDLLKERGKMLNPENPEPWDRVLAPLLGLVGVFIPLTAGLARRFWIGFGFGLAIQVAALLVFISGHIIGSYAMIENRFFSVLVRIQEGRGHEVVASGPYRWVRHPGYLGAILTYAALLFIFDSLWVALPATLSAAVLVIRTAYEDRTLQENLPGYKEYTIKVRYRLFPYIW